MARPFTATCNIERIKPDQLLSSNQWPHQIRLAVNREAFCPSVRLYGFTLVACVQVTEGLDVLQAINEAFVDGKFRPIQNIRIRHTVVLDDPFPDPPQLLEHVPETSPPPVFAEEVRPPP